MTDKHFTWQDLAAECDIRTGCYTLDGKPLGAEVHVPPELYNQYPYNAPVYRLLQQLRQEIFELGLLFFPDLPFNRCNYTLAQRAPQQHSYSSNHYMTDWCQMPHQDTPPYPTAFGLYQPRRYFATWILSRTGVERFFEAAQTQRDIMALHRQLVPETLAETTGLLANQQPGLILIDNSNHRQLYHARTCNFAAIDKQPDFTEDAPMYAFNEVGLLNYIDQLDSRRGQAWRNRDEMRQVAQFMQKERLT